MEMIGIDKRYWQCEAFHVGVDMHKYKYGWREKRGQMNTESEQDFQRLFIYSGGLMKKTYGVEDFSTSKYCEMSRSILDGS